ncbi:MAG: LysM peptidoglycan-binding domain-containing protein [Dehalococcoidia bacterium]|nr:LysM peptidoglycan-binding domain-containing protein [Dehalococcoidia bacterium]
MAVHVVVEGDTLSAIAEAHGTTLAEVIGLNPQIANPDLIYPGQEVNIPASAEAPSEAVTDATAAATVVDEAATVVAEAASEAAPAAEQPAEQPAAEPAAAVAAPAAPVLEGRLAE